MTTSIVDTTDVESHPSLPMEKCVVNKQEIEIPEALSDSHVFSTVFSQDTWKNVLTDSQRKHLQKFLPNFPNNDSAEKQVTVKKLFDGDNFKFGNSLNQFHKRLKGGRYTPDIAKYLDLCKRAKYREYRQEQLSHYSNVLKEVLINRQRILEAATVTAPDGPIRYEHFQMSQVAPQKTNLKSRVKRRCAQILQELNEECGTEETSSSDDDEEDYQTLSRNRRQLLKVLRPGSPEDDGSGVLGTFDPQPPPPTTPLNGADGVTVPKPLVLKRCRSPVEMTHYDLRQMLCNHKRRKASEPTHPELSVGMLTLEDIVTRVQATKKLPKATQRKRNVREKLIKKPTVKVQKPKVFMEPMSVEELPPEGTTESVVVTESPSVEEISVKSEPDNSSQIHRNVLPADPEEFPTHAHFFSLVRDLVYEDPEQRVTTGRLEERVREWQESSVAPQNVWFSEQSSWVEQVQPVLKFLSGDVLGLSMENFVPYLDYKERAQHWKWIGGDRDSDRELEPLYSHWLAHKDELPLDTHPDMSGSPPPPRVRTTYTVRPSSDEDKAAFRAQEDVRFRCPHQAFTYVQHAYECVVGPVKGVYAKENAMNKAREHTLLVSERPPYVTILTLVRDAAARLPNGEGTRNDICELLKDSQFLAPGVTENQINTVVSGALDRLHYERDPCVKYDVSRKLWIYLHRNRTEQEFERIHLAQGAAVKAKKALQKPKLPKKSKEGLTVSVTSTTSVSIATLARQSSTLSTCSSDSFVNVETLSPHLPAPVPSTPTTLATPQTPAPPPTPPAKAPSVPSSPKVALTTQSPRTTPQPSPKGVGAPPASPKVQAGVTMVPAGKLVSSTLNQNVTTTNHALTMAMFQAQAARHMTPGAASARLPLSMTQVTMTQTPPSTPRPVTLSLLQTQSQGKPASQQSVAQPQRLTTVPASTGKVVVGQVPGGKLVQALGPRLAIGQTVSNKVVAGQVVGGKIISPAQSPSGKLTVAQVQAQLQAQAQAKVSVAPQGATRTVLLQASPGTSVPRSAGLQAQVSAPAQAVSDTTAPQAVQLQIPPGSTSHTVAAALAKAGIVSKVSGPGQQPQLLNLNSLFAQQPGLLAGAVPVTAAKVDPGLKQVKIPGSMVQTRATTAITMVTQSPATGDTTPASPSVVPIVSKTTHPVSIVRAAKSSGVVITKPTASRSTATTQTVAQIIQSGALSKSAVIGGKPIIIGGKSGIMAGRQLQIGGKPVQLIGKGGQLGLVHQATTATSTLTQATSTTVSIVTTQSKTQAAPTMVSQLLQQQQLQKQQQQQQNVLSVAEQGGQIKVATSQLQTQQIKVASSQPQTKLVTLSQGLTSLGQQQLTSLKTVVAGGNSGGKNLMLPGGSVIQGSQLLVQSAQQPGSSAKVLTQQQVLTAGGNVRPTLLSTTGAKGLQNFQLVKTVISQPGGKPGQTTILLAQPSNQPPGSVATSPVVAATQGVKVAPGTITKGKGAPIYARIISPPQGVRLAAIRPGQVIAGHQVAPLQSLGMVQAQGTQGVAVEKTVTMATAPGTVVTGEPASGSEGPT